MKKLFIFSLLFFSTTASAAHNCVGKVNKIDIHGTSRLHVNIQGIGDGNILCALNQKLGEY